jgi:hypothetical protein
MRSAFIFLQFSEEKKNYFNKIVNVCMSAETEQRS